MRAGRATLGLLLTIVIVFPLSGAWAHPADGYEPKELQPGYGTEDVGLGPECNINDLYFVRPYPDPSTLTDQEKYMLAGAQGGPPGTLRPWYEEIFQAVSGYYGRTGVLPAQFSAAIMRELAIDPNDIPAERLELFKSPLTGEFPRLDAVDFSAGDIYMRPVTEEEKRHLAEHVPHWHDIWFAGECLDVATGETKSVMLLSDVFYVRVYGLNDVIHTGIHFIWTSR